MGTPPECNDLGAVQFFDDLSTIGLKHASNLFTFPS